MPQSLTTRRVLLGVTGLTSIMLVWFIVCQALAANDPIHSPTNNKPAERAEAKRFPTLIRQPVAPVVDTGLVNPHGDTVSVSCATCHATRKPNFDNKRTSDLNEFHTSLKFSHGSVSCLSCHNSTDYDALKLADGTRVEFSNVMTLCAQCHGQQMKDYEHGVHGGGSGYWDLSRGARTKNNCVDCHHPHSPQFPHMQPTFKPRDRFLEQDVEGKH